jgi:hypothetical protein
MKLVPNEHPETRFLKIICAWQHFAGKPLAILDHVGNLQPAELDQAEKTLRNLAVSFSCSAHAEVRKLGQQVLRALER